MGRNPTCACKCVRLGTPRGEAQGRRAGRTNHAVTGVVWSVPICDGGVEGAGMASKPRDLQARQAAHKSCVEMMLCVCSDTVVCVRVCACDILNII